jgi:cytoskeletal protein RodZ
MKRCQKCGYENADAMRFCLECGTALTDAPMVINLSDKPTESLSGGAPTNFGARRETETFVAGRGAVPHNLGNFTAQPPPKSNKKLFLILGGLASLLVLLGVAGAAIVFYNYRQNKLVSASPTPTASPTAKTGKSPTPKTSATATPTPAESPEKTPEASFTPPVEPTKKATFTVNADEGWQLSDIDVVSLEKFRTSVQGAIDLAGIKSSVPPAGLTDAKTKSRRVYPEFPTGALLMRTRYADGKTSNTVSMTTNGANGNWENYPNETGKLEFCINDNSPAANGGQFIVTVTMTGVPKAKK